MIEAVDGGKEMYTQSIPTDSNTSKSLAMDLCQALLKKALDSDWVEEMVREDALWIIGDFPEDENCTYPYSIQTLTLAHIQAICRG